MSEQESNTDVLIDRLVDGELPSDERRRLLLSLESQPEGWRRCALAFIEAQTWRDQMRGVLAPAGSRPQLDADATAPCQATLTLATADDKPRPRYTGLWLAAAACLLLAFGLGRQVGVAERENFQRIQLAAGVGHSEASPDARLAEPAPGENAVTLVVNDTHGVPRRLTVPLVEGRQLGAEFADTPNWSSPELARRLDERGLGIAARRRYVPLFFEQQNQQVPFIVPVDDAVVTPVSRPVF
jgi:anti-sigma factor RsiW